MQHGVKPGFKRLAMDIPEDDHKRVKRMALEHNISAKTYLYRIIMAHLDHDEKLLGLKGTPVEDN